MCTLFNCCAFIIAVKKSGEELPLSTAVHNSQCLLGDKTGTTAIDQCCVKAKKLEKTIIMQNYFKTCISTRSQVLLTDKRCCLCSS